MLIADSFQKTYHFLFPLGLTSGQASKKAIYMICNTYIKMSARKIDFIFSNHSIISETEYLLCSGDGAATKQEARQRWPLPLYPFPQCSTDFYLHKLKNSSNSFGV